ncbi:MAG: hypothetical protein ACKO96_25455, partial [Flammeovirgaceae bacterium]
MPSGNVLQDNPYPYVFGNFTIIDSISKKIINNSLSDQAARSNPLNWYLYDCSSVLCNQTLLGNNSGSQLIINPDGTTLLGSII